MTTTKIKMIQASLAILAASVLAQTASAASLTVSRSRTIAKCYGDYDVKVLDWAGYGSALYIYDGGRLVSSQWVDKQVAFDGRVETTSFHTDEDVFDGGASLRIRSKDTRIPQTEGTAWLTFDGGNARLDCSVY
jgi:hypothetical protein